jgi:hypothetical protein
MVRGPQQTLQCPHRNTASELSVDVQVPDTAEDPLHELRTGRLLQHDLHLANGIEDRPGKGEANLPLTYTASSTPELSCWRDHV